MLVASIGCAEALGRQPGPETGRAERFLSPDQDVGDVHDAQDLRASGTAGVAVQGRSRIFAPSAFPAFSALTLGCPCFILHLLWTRVNSDHSPSNPNRKDVVPHGNRRIGSGRR